jgi:hypothetical protein
MTLLRCAKPNFRLLVEFWKGNTKHPAIGDRMAMPKLPSLTAKGVSADALCEKASTLTKLVPTGRTAELPCLFSVPMLCTA